jgi:hypothetical protein
MQGRRIVIELDYEVGSILVYDKDNPLDGIDILDISEFETALDIVRTKAGFEPPLDN